MASNRPDDHYSRFTVFAWFGNNIASAPLLAAYNFIGVILYRDLGGEPFHLTVLTMLRPVVAVLALYWSFQIAHRADRIRSNLVWAGFLGRLPFFYFPFVSDPWSLIVPAAFYMLLWRGGIPAWMEIFKRNLPEDKQSKVFSTATALGYMEGIILTVGIGWLLDQHHSAWRWIFPLAALFGMAAVLIQASIPIRDSIPRPAVIKSQVVIWERLWRPWADSFNLLKSRRDFRNFQTGYMLAGAGMMVMQPALPIFFVDVLHVTYTELAVALTFCKGTGFGLTARLWASWFNRANPFTFSCAIFGCVAIFPAILFLAQISIANIPKGGATIPLRPTIVTFTLL